MGDDKGFTLIEMLAVLAIVALLAGLVLPTLTNGSTRSEVDAYAVRLAALLKSDRHRAIRHGLPVATAISAERRVVSSGDGQSVVRLPEDMRLEAILADRCAGLTVRGRIVFFPSGMSCGGTLTLARGGIRAEVRVNWLTGGVEIVKSEQS